MGALGDHERFEPPCSINGGERVLTKATAQWQAQAAPTTAILKVGQLAERGTGLALASESASEGSAATRPVKSCSRS